MKTKKMVYERIRLLKEYSEQLKELQSGILYDIYPYDNDTLERVTKELQALVAGERTPEEAIENIDSYKVRQSTTSIEYLAWAWVNVTGF